MFEHRFEHISKLHHRPQDASTANRVVHTTQRRLLATEGHQPRGVTRTAQHLSTAARPAAPHARGTCDRARRDPHPPPRRNRRRPRPRRCARGVFAGGSSGPCTRRDLDGDRDARGNPPRARRRAHRRGAQGNSRTDAHRDPRPPPPGTLRRREDVHRGRGEHVRQLLRSGLELLTEQRRSVHAGSHLINRMHCMRLRHRGRQQDTRTRLLTRWFEHSVRRNFTPGVGPRSGYE